MTATPIPLLNNQPAPHLRAVYEAGVVVAVADLSGALLYLPVGGTGPIPDLDVMMRGAKQPPREIVKCDGLQFFPLSWIVASGIEDAAVLDRRAHDIRAKLCAAKLEAC